MVDCGVCRLAGVEPNEAPRFGDPIVAGAIDEAVGQTLSIVSRKSPTEYIVGLAGSKTIPSLWQ